MNFDLLDEVTSAWKMYEEELDSYTKKNVYGGDGRHYKNEPATPSYPNRMKFPKF